MCTHQEKKNDRTDKGRDHQTGEGDPRIASRRIREKGLSAATPEGDPVAVRRDVLGGCDGSGEAGLPMGGDASAQDHHTCTATGTTVDGKPTPACPACARNFAGLNGAFPMTAPRASNAPPKCGWCGETNPDRIAVSTSVTGYWCIARHDGQRSSDATAKHCHVSPTCGERGSTGLCACNCDGCTAILRAEQRTNDAPTDDWKVEYDGVWYNVHGPLRSTRAEALADLDDLLRSAPHTDKATSAEEVRDAALQEAEDAIKAIRFKNGIMGVGADYAADAINGLRSAPAPDPDKS